MFLLGKIRKIAAWANFFPITMSDECYKVSYLDTQQSVSPKQYISEVFVSLYLGSRCIPKELIKIECKNIRKFEWTFITIQTQFKKGSCFGVRNAWD